MCNSPGILADGTQIACRNCSLCHRRARNDWIGRCIAESKTAKACHVINLTYGRNRHGDVLHERSVLLTYSDIQKFLKLLRFHGYPLRYLVTGEYGNEKGRAHWHIILFWQDKVPPFAGWDQYGNWLQKAEEEQRFDWVRLNEDGNPARDSEGEPLYFWPHGFAYWQSVNQRTIQYVCYYVLKELDHEGRQYHLGMSKKPPIGQAYFEQLAERMVEAGIAPQTPEYRFPGVTRRNKAKGCREAIPFWLKGRPLELFLDHFIATWAEFKGNQPRPKSELVDLYEEWGRVVHDEYAVAERAAPDRRAVLKGDMRDRGDTPWEVRYVLDKSSKYPSWDPFFDATWKQSNGVSDFQYYRDFVDDEEKRRPFEDAVHHEKLIDLWEQCVQGGEPSEYWFPGSRIWYENVCSILTDHHGYESVDEWQRQRKSEREHPEVHSEPVKPDYGLGKIGTWNKHYPKADGASTGPGAGS